jgi:malto-oligosyltrehalose trehalohydrolase
MDGQTLIRSEPRLTARGNFTRSQGADVTDSGVRYRTWADKPRVELTVSGENGQNVRTYNLTAEGGCYFSGIDNFGRVGDLYRYGFGDESFFPDPASRWQPAGVHGPSMVIDPSTFQWTDDAFSRPEFRDLVIYELHIGTFTSEGTFAAAISRLEHIAALGATAVEIMPIADFPGTRNWGYDGVALYAPPRAYGHPDDLRALVDAAHAHGLAVILDVVYNHLGPDGNYVGAYHSKYFNPRHKTPWGDGYNYELPAVRNFFAENPIYWMEEFHIDGFRLDATHAIADSSSHHILAEIAERVHFHGGFIIAEDERNEPRLLTGASAGGIGFDGCWADDFHHVVRVTLTGEREGYYKNYRGTHEELAETLQHGWLYRGQRQISSGKCRGGDTAGLLAEQFVFCISNHDQTGNRAFGERLHHVIDAAQYRAASALLCLVPETPMLFMGQEWSTTTPFQFFTDHNQELGRKITEGRREEFRHFAAFADPNSRDKIPDPQSRETFFDSKLRWEEIKQKEHTGVLLLYRELLRLRQSHPALRNRARENYEVRKLDDGIVAIVYGVANDRWFAVVSDLKPRNRTGGFDSSVLKMPAGLKWRRVVSSNETRFGGVGDEQFNVATTLALEAFRHE